ncbi:hypothetical protein OTU49_000126, partial [Cherax quadricarinatus]
MLAKMDDAGWESVANVRFQPLPGATPVHVQEMRTARIVETVAKKPASQENVIEAEIRAQQLKEVAMRQEGTLKSTSSSSSTTTTTTTVVREKGASSPASHDSDEGFVDRLVEDVPITPTSGYTHTIAGNDGEPVIYDTVSPPPEYFSE